MRHLIKRLFDAFTQPMKTERKKIHLTPEPIHMVDAQLNLTLFLHVHVSLSAVAPGESCCFSDILCFKFVFVIISILHGSG